MINYTIFTKRLWEVFSQPVPPKRESDVTCHFWATVRTSTDSAKNGQIKKQEMNHTDEQKKVYSFVQFDSNHGIIDAVAGSGKTTTIVESASYLDKSKRVLFCAFNNSIQKEIASRFFKKGLSGIQVKTMHSLGLDLLRSNSTREYKLEATKYDKLIEQFLKQDQDTGLLENLCILNAVPFHPQNKTEEYQLKNFFGSVKFILTDTCTKTRLTLTKFEIDEFKKMMVHYNILNEKKAASKAFDEEVKIYFQLAQLIVNKGNYMAEKVNLIDFADMLYQPVLNKLTPIHKFDLLFVDECQDLSKSQLAIALKYVKKDGRVLAVGDPSQSIYGFTGADIESFNRIKSKLPNIVTLALSKCFRCPSSVVELAQSFRSDITSFEPKEGTIQKIEFNQVIDFAKPTNLIISRTKAPLQVLMFKMIEKGIAIEVHEDEVKEFINDLRFLFSQDELNATAVYSNGNDFFEKVKERNVSFIEKKSFRFKDKDEKEKFVAEETNLIDAKIEFIQQQLSIHTETKTINGLLKKIEVLISGGDNSIKLSTIHRAKGLENDTVFILDYDTLPLYRDGQKGWEKIQENNLKYVALTRTRKNLFLVNSEPIGEVGNDISLFDTIDDIW
jgi:DNA helicase-2/ATP-dependent DNA helicase PcrA